MVENNRTVTIKMTKGQACGFADSLTITYFLSKMMS